MKFKTKQAVTVQLPNSTFRGNVLDINGDWLRISAVEYVEGEKVYIDEWFSTLAKLVHIF